MLTGNKRRVAVLLASLAGVAWAQDVPPASATGDAPPPQSVPPGAASPDAAPMLPTIPVEPGDTALPEPPPLEEPGSSQLDEIVVTATKRTQNVREIPATIVGFSGEDLERANVKGIEDLARLVPGVNVTQPGEGTPRVTIRGIASQPLSNATTGILYGDIGFNDVYLPRVVPDPLPFDLQSVEVLKGPQGTLFGAGALNGAIRYVPEPAALGVSEAKYVADYTSIDHGGAAPTFGAVINLPLSGGEAAALRLTGYRREAPGYIDNTQLGPDGNVMRQDGARGSLVVAPTGWLSGTLTYAWQESRHDDNAVADNVDGELTTGNRPRRSPSVLEYQFADFKAEADLEWARLISDTGFVRKTGDSFFDASSRLNGSLRTPLRASQTDQAASDTWSQELRLVSQEDPGSRWQWVAGVAGFRQVVDFRFQLPVSVELGLAGPVLPVVGGILNAIPGLRDAIDSEGQALLARIDTHAEIEELALFGELTRRLGDHWEVSLGGRLYRTESAGTARQAGLLLTAVNGQPERTVEGTLREEGFNPKVSLLYRASRDLIAYAAASKGFRVGGVQPGYALRDPPPPDFFRSDTLWNYEIGLRTQWLDRMLRADVTAFHIDWEDPQTFQLGSDGLSSFIDNVGGVTGDGVEAALQAVLPWGFQLNASASWTDTRTSETFQSQNGEVAPGAQWPFAPHWQTSSSLVWILPVSSYLVSSSVTYSTIDRAPNTLDPVAARDVFGYDQLDLRVSIADPATPWMPEVTLTLDNVTDERGVTNNFEGGLVPGLTFVDGAYIRPRTLTVRIAGRF